ncbi:MAG: TIGR03792 family protein [Ilumatobacteraceae bacterium]|jgi:uncharacterized protein (TIGR03792 family)|nr:TIGR03792 family protein [Ilumatobacteraceae bacterium]
MVIEFLTFEVDPPDRDHWLAVEERTWSRFLADQPGFVRKEVWLDPTEPQRIHAMIQWESEERWRAVSTEAIAAVDRSMGPWHRPCTCRTFHVLRTV